MRDASVRFAWAREWAVNIWLAARFPRRRMLGRHCGMRPALARCGGEASSRGLLASARCVAPSLSSESVRLLCLTATFSYDTSKGAIPARDSQVRPGASALAIWLALALGSHHARARDCLGTLPSLFTPAANNLPQPHVRKCSVGGDRRLEQCCPACSVTVESAVMPASESTCAGGSRLSMRGVTLLRVAAACVLLAPPCVLSLPTSEKKHAREVAEQQERHRLHLQKKNQRVQEWGDTAIKMPWDIEGKVDDCCCDASFVVEHSKSGGVDAVLSELTMQPFFRIFKVNLQRECQFAGIADEQPDTDDCAVGECGDAEVPTFWRNEEGCLTIAPNRSKADCAKASLTDNDVDYTVLTEFDSFPTSESGVSIVQGSQEESEGGTGGGELRYVNLARNPERYTGYTGYTATRVWDAICEPSPPPTRHLCSLPQPVTLTFDMTLSLLCCAVLGCAVLLCCYAAVL